MQRRLMVDDLRVRGFDRRQRIGRGFVDDRRAERCIEFEPTDQAVELILTSVYRILGLQDVEPRVGDADLVRNTES